MGAAAAAAPGERLVLEVAFAEDDDSLSLAMEKGHAIVFRE